MMVLLIGLVAFILAFLFLNSMVTAAIIGIVAAILALLYYRRI